MVQTIEDMIHSHGGFITTKEISSSSVYHRLLEQVKKGSVVRIRPGVYALNDCLANTMIDLRKTIPGGVLCQYSAWFHYALTTQIPMFTYVAVERGRQMILPDYPPIKLCRISKEYLPLGVVDENIGGYDVPVYDIERSVCDAVKSRNKIGIDVCSEILKTYLARKDCNLPKLMRYAKTLRVLNTLNKYLEIEL